MKACVKVFASKVGTGVQTVTGIVDSDGVTFAADRLIFIHTESVVNTLDWGDDLSNSMADNRGIASATQGASGSLADIGRHDIKIASTGFGRHYSLLDLQADDFFGGNFQGYGYVSAIRDGEFDITWDLQNRGGYAVIVAAFAGSDLTVDVIQSTLNGAHSTSTNPQGVFFWGDFGAFVSSPTDALIGAGGNDLQVGWDTRSSGRGIAAYTVGHQTGNARGTITDRCLSGLSVSTGWTSTGTISAWGGSSYTISGGGSSSTAALAFCGTNIRTAAGSFRAPAVASQVSIPIGIKAKWVVIASVGVVPSPTASLNGASFSMGWTDGTRQGAMWVGEQTSTNVNPIKGARYLSDAEMIRLGTANAGSTTFQTIAELVSLNPTGAITLDFTNVDGTEPELVWFAVGEAIPAPPEPDRRVIRRLRRFQHLNQTHLLLFLDQFELYLQSGVGNSDAPDPQIMLRYSKDGGHRWSAERWMSAGAVGEYSKRLRWLNLGRARDWTFEIVASDPVVWNLIECYANVREGTS